MIGESDEDADNDEDEVEPTEVGMPGADESDDDAHWYSLNPPTISLPAAYLQSHYLFVSGAILYTRGKTS